MDSSANPSTVGQRSRPAPLAKTTPRLRDIPTSSRFFWRDELQEYLTQRVRDRTHDSTNDRDLPPNEIDCLALNEIAVSEGQGFFFFLPSRVSFSHQTFDPKNRGPSIEDLRASVPSLVFMRYAWSERGQNKFFATPHRSRYLACDFQLNPPPTSTPLYCIQVVSGPRYPVYKTEHTSFIMIRSEPVCFASMDDLAPILGAPSRKRKGADAGDRLGQVEGCWKGSQNDKYQPYAYTNLHELYKAITSACHPSKFSSSMTSQDLLQLLPRPMHPELGLALGGDYFTVADRSRFGARLGRAHVLDDANTTSTEDGTLS